MNKLNKDRLAAFLRQTEDAIQARDVEEAREAYTRLINAQVIVLEMGETLDSEFLEQFDVVMNELAGLESLVEFTEPIFVGVL